MREISETHLQGVDAVIHLAAISNDPMGSRFEKITEEINFRASLELARSCVRQGVRHFVFASSCSLYGFLCFLPMSAVTSKTMPQSGSVSPWSVWPRTTNYPLIFTGAFGIRWTPSATKNTSKSSGIPAGPPGKSGNQAGKISQRLA